jgi:hypothetical protein
MGGSVGAAKSTCGGPFHQSFNPNPISNPFTIKRNNEKKVKHNMATLTLCLFGEEVLFQAH